MGGWEDHSWEGLSGASGTGEGNLSKHTPEPHCLVAPGPSFPAHAMAGSTTGRSWPGALGAPVNAPPVPHWNCGSVSVAQVGYLTHLYKAGCWVSRHSCCWLAWSPACFSMCPAWATPESPDTTQDFCIRSSGGPARASEQALRGPGAGQSAMSTRLAL